MAAIKISTLTAKTVPVAADSFVIVDSAAADNKKVSYSDLRSTILDAETTINESGADVDFRVESDTKTHALFVQGSNGFVGINKTVPTRQLDVVGNTSLDGAVTINETGVDVNFRVEGVGESNALFVQGSDGFVGIGTGTPATELEVDGNIGFTSDGQGIDFGNSSGGSSTSTVLDDYEEGTWTPDVFAGGTSATHSAQIGTYTKIGDTVYITAYVSVSSFGGTGVMAIQGLPYTPSGVTNEFHAVSVSPFGLSTANPFLHAWVNDSNDIISLASSNGAGSDVLVPVDTNFSLKITGFYRI